MANNRELLKEALADAKSLREMAITNAKAALEESFAPQIKSMLSTKLQEMEEDEGEIEEVESVEEEYQNEDLNLDEILAELEESDDSEEVEPLAEVEEDEEEVGGDMDEEEDEEPMELEDMSEDDLKGFIESVIADMVEAGSLEAGEDMEDEDMEDEDMEDMDGEIGEDDVNIDELLAEIELEEDDSEDEMVDESKIGDWMNKTFSVNQLGKSFLKSNAGEFQKLKSNPTPEGIDAFIAKFTDEMEDKYATSKIFASDRNAIRTLITGKESGGKTTHTAENLELSEAYKAIKTLKSELNEVNLLNAKLLYTNRIFKSKNLTESQKVKVLSTFDKASNVNEVELVYETLNGTFNTKKKPMNENLGRASRTTGSTKTTKSPIIVDAAYKRMQELAFYDVKH